MPLIFTRKAPVPAIDAGRLDRRVVLLEPITNEYGDEIIGWQPVTSVWAAVDPAVSREIAEAARTVAVVEVSIMIRYRDDIEARWRIQDREKTYEVRGVVDVARRHVMLALNCEEVQ